MNKREAPKCPWCGNKMDDRTSTMTSSCYFICQNCRAASPIAYTYDAAYAAAVKRAETENRVLTLDEIKQIYSTNKNHAWPYDTPPYFFFEAIHGKQTWYPWSYVIDMLEGDFMDCTEFNYGITWRCWLRKPTDEERAAAPWKEADDGQA